MYFKKTAFIAALLTITIPVLSATPTNEELLELIKKQQLQIEQLMKMVKDANNKIEQTDDKVESTVDAIEATIDTASLRH